MQELKKLWEARPSYPLAAQGKEAQELSAEQVVAESARLLDLLRGERRPLIHHITVSRRICPPSAALLLFPPPLSC